MARDDQVVLNFHNSLLRKSDVSLLTGSQWLNDRLIGFFLEYLENVVCKHVADKVTFVCPEIVQFLKSVSSVEAISFLESMNLTGKTYIFMPVNDSQSLESPGGTHWSLLVFQKPNMFFHYDSFGQTNANSAMAVVRSISPHLCQSLQVNYVNQKCPQQTNGYDCGVHLILNADVLVRHFVFDAPLDWYVEKDVDKTRKRLHALILALGGGNTTHKF